MTDTGSDVLSNVESGRNIVIIPGPNQDFLTDKQAADYHRYREAWLQWLLHLGKDPESAQGYSEYTVYETGYRSAAFDRWVWERDGYQIPPSPSHADAYLQEIAYSDRSQATKGKIEEMLVRYFRWLSQERGGDEWEPSYSFDSSGGSSPKDFLTVPERRAIRQQALEHGDIPAYGSLSPSERAQWKSYVARVLGETDPSPEDWDRVDGWKITSMVWTSLDAGLRPVEVGRARTSWVDVENAVLRIPREEASKSEESWVVSLTERTADALDRWLDERSHYDRYTETDALWLTTHGNPYGSRALSRLLQRLATAADIRTDNRDLTWYAIRHSVGTYMAREEDLAAAQSQLRHESPQTTMKYDQAPVEDRRDALDQMG